MTMTYYTDTTSQPISPSHGAHRGTSLGSTLSACTRRFSVFRAFAMCPKRSRKRQTSLRATLNLGAPDEDVEDVGVCQEYMVMIYVNIFAAPALAIARVAPGTTFGVEPFH